MLVPDMLPGLVPHPCNAFQQGMFYILMRYPVLKRCYALLMYIHCSLLCMPSEQGRVPQIDALSSADLL
jgi:hypothetical protein